MGRASQTSESHNVATGHRAALVKAAPQAGISQRPRCVARVPSSAHCPRQPPEVPVATATHGRRPLPARRTRAGTSRLVAPTTPSRLVARRRLEPWSAPTPLRPAPSGSGRGRWCTAGLGGARSGMQATLRTPSAAAGCMRCTPTCRRAPPDHRRRCRQPCPAAGAPVLMVWWRSSAGPPLCPRPWPRLAGRAPHRGRAADGGPVSCVGLESLCGTRGSGSGTCGGSRTVSNEVWKHACVAGRANIHIFMFRLDMDLDGTLSLEVLAAALAWAGQCRRLVLDPVLAHPRRMLERVAAFGAVDCHVGGLGVGLPNLMHAACER
eukprot:m.154694 g.154694  ORF g.154694 m.154694 type:complete len:322 (-) comp11719_c0_seq4:4259-5224(-)